jgi:hypothetical protein
VSWEIVIFGDLEFPPGGMDAWRQARVDPRVYRDWPDPFASDADGDEVAWQVGTWLDEYAAWSETAQLHYLDVTAGSTRLELRGYLEKSPPQKNLWVSHSGSGRFPSAW